MPVYCYHCNHLKQWQCSTTSARFLFSWTKQVANKRPLNKSGNKNSHFNATTGRGRTRWGVCPVVTDGSAARQYCEIKYTDYWLANFHEGNEVVGKSIMTGTTKCPPIPVPRTSLSRLLNFTNTVLIYVWTHYW